MNKSTQKQVVQNCKVLLKAYKTGDLGQTVMPEDTNPGFTKREQELRLAYFSLPMSLNYQRNSYALWKAALETFHDEKTKPVYSVSKVASMTEEQLRNKLLLHKLALQPQKHINTWKTISKTVYENWGSFSNLLQSADNDFLTLQQIIQVKYKKGFPYLSGPKIFHYWSSIINTYGQIKLKNREYIEIAPDTHVLKCSVLLGVITQTEATTLTRDKISARWRSILEGSGIAPIDMHSPLWFWSHNNFLLQIPVKNKLKSLN